MSCSPSRMRRAPPAPHACLADSAIRAARGLPTPRCSAALHHSVDHTGTPARAASAAEAICFIINHSAAHPTLMLTMPRDSQRHLLSSSCYSARDYCPAAGKCPGQEQCLWLHTARPWLAEGCCAVTWGLCISSPTTLSAIILQTHIRPVFNNIADAIGLRPGQASLF